MIIKAVFFCFNYANSSLPSFHSYVIALNFIEYSFEYSASKSFKLRFFHFMVFNTALHSFIILSKPTGYVMHHQFNIQQLYALPTLYLCVLYLSENKQRLVPLTA